MIIHSHYFLGGVGEDGEVLPRTFHILDAIKKLSWLFPRR